MPPEAGPSSKSQNLKKRGNGFEALNFKDLYFFLKFESCLHSAGGEFGTWNLKPGIYPALNSYSDRKDN
jgi:hypothetical protein